LLEVLSVLILQGFEPTKERNHIPMPEILNQLLNQPQNRCIMADKGERLNNVLARLKKANGKNWWHLIVDWGDGNFRAIMFAELAKQLAASDPQTVFEPLAHFDIPLARTVENRNFDAQATLKLARQQPNGFVIIVQNGVPLGLVLAAGTRSASDGFNIMNYYVANVTDNFMISDNGQEVEQASPDIETDGGTYIKGNVNVQHGDFVGRDKTDQVIVFGEATIIYQGQPATKPAGSIEEAIRLDVAAPESAMVNAIFYLAVAVRQPGSPHLAIDDLTQITSTDGSIIHSDSDEVIRYRIEVQESIWFEVTPRYQILKLRPRQNSHPCFFQLIPHKSGQCNLVVTAFQEDESLAAQTRINVRVEVPVQSAPSSGQTE
jgi:hypothetical protein